MRIVIAYIQNSSQRKQVLRELVRTIERSMSQAILERLGEGK